MIELAPRHKIGLALASPVLLASGCCGYGSAYQELLDLALFGALVTQPITLRPQRGSPQPRLVETPAGFILNSGLQNPGVKKVIQQHSKSWFRLGAPVIAHLPADELENLMRTARALSGIQTPQGHPALAAIELGLPHHSAGADIEHWLRALREGTDLPLLAKLPLGAPPDLAEAAVRAQADALVIGAPPLGAGYLPRSQQIITGHLYGPALHSLALHQLRQAARFDLPLVAAGGIHSLFDAQAFLEAGAAAVQIDSLLFIDLKLAQEIALAFRQAQEAIVRKKILHF
jgi:dihydroorotate dehydrogenase (NAD+) catalytic subunit